MGRGQILIHVIPAGKSSKGIDRGARRGRGRGGRRAGRLSINHGCILVAS
jgi:hypothetical protein